MPTLRSLSPSPALISISTTSSSSSLSSALPFPLLPRRKTQRLVLAAVYAVVVFTASYQAVSLLVTRLPVGLDLLPISVSHHDDVLPAPHDPIYDQTLPGALRKAAKTPPVAVSRPVRAATLGLDGKSGDRRSPVPRAPPHEWRSDGLLVVNPEGRHPVLDLIENAEKKWEEMQDRQSKSLDEAVAEYRRRYKRAPPKGFDRWWDYVEAHNVQLPDEYDQIHRDLEHFWAVSPQQLRDIQSAHEAHRDSFTIGKSHRHPLVIVNASLPEDESRNMHLNGAREIIDVLKPVEEYIPPFRAVFSPHDNPNLVMSWDAKRRALEAVAQGKHLNVDELSQGDYMGWLAACAPTSAARQTPFDLSNPPPPPTRKSFVHSHVAAMDPCQHPSLLHQHGQFVSHREGPWPDVSFVPQFSYSTTSLHYDIRPAAPNNWIEDVNAGDDKEWEEKSQERLMWRGGNTGIWHDHDTLWRSAQRIRLVGLGKARDGSVDVLRELAADGVGGKPGVDVVQLSRDWVSEDMLDIHFAGKPFACAEETCPVLATMFDWQPNMNWHEAGKYKYVVDVDGNGWSSRFKRLITSRSLIFKSTVYPEWFSERIAPWVHYIPVQNDLSDLLDSYAFFRGVPDANGTFEGGHDDLARKIAYAGREWSLTHWRREDLTAYMFRLFLEYARLMSLERNEMDFQDIESEFW